MYRKLASHLSLLAFFVIVIVVRSYVIVIG